MFYPLPFSDGPRVEGGGMSMWGAGKWGPRLRELVAVDEVEALSIFISNLNSGLLN